MANIRILGIESSCDETGIAIYDEQQGIIAHQLYSQVKLHQEYGGVVPELASRDHVRKIIPLIEATLAEANLKSDDISAIAYTQGPGLIGALLVGATVGKSLAYAWGCQAIGVHHLEGHLLAPMLETPAPEFPFLALLVSGGHTLIVEVASLGHYQIIGESIDDAAGEAFDKVAKMLSLPYPGGPVLDKLAQLGNPNKFTFTHPKVPDLNYSFSGLKTSVLYFLKKEIKTNPNFIEENLNDICASVQKTIIDILLIELKKAIKQTGIQQIAIAGGVSANSELRKRLASFSKDYQIYIPKMEYCTDNAAMIAISGYYKYLEQDFTVQDIAPNARMKI